MRPTPLDQRQLLAQRLDFHPGRGQRCGDGRRIGRQRAGAVGGLGIFALHRGDVVGIDEPAIGLLDPGQRGPGDPDPLVCRAPGRANHQQAVFQLAQAGLGGEQALLQRLPRRDRVRPAQHGQHGAAVDFLPGPHRHDLDFGKMGIRNVLRRGFHRPRPLQKDQRFCRPVGHAQHGGQHQSAIGQPHHPARRNEPLVIRIARRAQPPQTHYLGSLYNSRRTLAGTKPSRREARHTVSETKA